MSMNNLDTLKNFITSVKNPQEAVMGMLVNNNNPVLQNLIKMANNGDYKGVENVARNIFKEQGRDFDSELKSLQNIIGGFK